MPVIKSAIKKARQDVKARQHNRGLRDAYKVAVKNVRKLAEAGDTKKAQEALKEAYSKIDIAAKKNVLHKNNAARRKSRLASLLKKDKPAKTEKKETKKESK
jgi:small subunit ribosomal protein S20